MATATACALLDLPCVVYMGAEDIERQQPNVLRMRALGAEVRAVTSGTATLKDAVNEAMRDWVTNVETTHYVLGSAMGPHPYPTIVRDLQRRIGDEAAAQLESVEGRLPDLAMACVGGGSNAIGLLARFIGEPTVRLAVVEAAGDGLETGRHAAAILGGTPGILHGSRSLMLQDADGQVVEAHSASAGLDYPGIGPQLAALAEGGRIEVASATDREAVAAMRTSTRTEGILPALETAHAIAALPKLLAGGAGPADARADDLLVLLGFSGRGDKDLAALERFADVEAWADGAMTASPRRSATGTNDTAGARRIAAAFDAARAEGRIALIPYVVAGYPDAETSFRAALAAADAGADLLEVGLPYSDPLADGATLQRASGVALAAGATLERSLRLLERIGAARPGPAPRPDGLREPGHRRRRWRGRGATARRGRSGRPDRGGPDAGRGGAVRGRRPRRRSRCRLPRRARRRRRSAGPGSRAARGGFLYCVSLVGVTGARTSLPASVGTLVREVKAASPVPVAVGFGVSQPAHVRAIAKAGADGVIVASALVDAMGPDGRDVDGLAALVATLRAATDGH